MRVYYFAYGAIAVFLGSWVSIESANWFQNWEFKNSGASVAITWIWRLLFCSFLLGGFHRVSPLKWRSGSDSMRYDHEWGGRCIILYRQGIIGLYN